jgi:hypothetical protein
MFGYKSPMGPAYGYRTDYKSKSGTKKGPATSKTGKVLKGVGRASGVIGLGLVAYNIRRHGAKEAAKQEGKFWVHDIPVGTMGGVTYLDNRLLGGSLSQGGRSSQITATVLLTGLIQAVI